MNNLLEQYQKSNLRYVIEHWIFTFIASECCLLCKDRQQPRQLRAIWKFGPSLFLWFVNCGAEATINSTVQWDRHSTVLFCVHLCNVQYNTNTNSARRNFAGQNLLARRLVRTALGLYMICALTWHVLDQYSIWAWNIFFSLVESEEIRCLASFLYVWRPSTPPAVNGKGSPWHQPYTQSPRTLQCHDGKSFQGISKHKKI